MHFSACFCLIKNNIILILILLFSILCILYIFIYNLYCIIKERTFGIVSTFLHLALSSSKSIINKSSGILLIKYFLTLGCNLRNIASVEVEARVRGLLEELDKSSSSALFLTLLVPILLSLNTLF